MAKIGLWLSTPEPLIAECAARAKPDWVGLDLQHGAWDLGSAFRGIQLLDALGMPVIARVSEQEPEAMPRLLDHGASGIVIAMASSVELTEETVRRARYQPEGVRSFGGQRYGFRAAPSDPAKIKPAVFPMIEDSRGAADIESIAAVEGIAGLHIGPVDLGLGLGLERSDPRFTKALKRILDAGHRSKKPVTMHAVRPEQAQKWMRMGFDEVVLTADIEIIRSAFETGVERVRSSGRAG